MSVQVGRHSSVAGVTKTSHMLTTEYNIYMERFMKLQHAIAFTPFCIFRAWPWLMRWILDNIKKISKFMTPCVLVKSGTNTLSKALQVRTVGWGTDSFPPYYSPPACPYPSLIHPNLNTRTLTLCVHTHKSHQHGRTTTFSHWLPATVTALVCLLRPWTFIAL